MAQRNASTFHMLYTRELEQQMHVKRTMHECTLESKQKHQSHRTIAEGKVFFNNKGSDCVASSDALVECTP